MIHLIVVQPFADYAKGDRIEDPEIVASILASANSSHVVKVAAPKPD